MTQLKGQQALCPPPDPSALLASAQYKPLLAEPGKYAPRHLKTRSHCMECVVALHEHHGKGPAPLPVRWRRTSESGHVDLCHPHKLAWSHADGSDRKKAKR